MGFDLEYMGFGDVQRMLEGDSNGNVIKNLISSVEEEPYIIRETLNMLKDSNPMCKIITEGNKRALLNMIKRYFGSCYDEYLGKTNFEEILKYNKVNIYKVDSSGGEREATVGEINNGVRGLKKSVRYTCGEEQYKKICLLYWTFNGRQYFYREAGYKLEYKDGKCVTTLYEMIRNSAEDIIKLMEWVGTEEYEKTIEKAKKFAKKKGYKYASFNNDEIKENISVKQLVIDIQKIFPRNSTDEMYRRALSLAIKAKDRKPEPMEISYMREAYEKFSASEEGKKKKEKSIDKELKSMCEAIDKEKESGKLGKNTFVFKVTETMRKEGYTKCSPKQLSIIREAYNKINKTDEEKGGKKDEVIETSASNISNYSTLSDILEG